jgi:3-deoxy-D-manno-octulosonic-acid transferase
MKWAYFLFVRLYPLMARLLAPFNTKAALWVKGRKKLLQKIQTELKLNKQPIIWMHAASLGEFEQGLPLVEKLKQLYPSHKLLVTFFSPSGYEVKKNHPIADWVFYLPMDSKSNAAAFIKITQPAIALFIKYEFWFFYLSELKKHQIPVLLVSGIFRPGQLFFKWYGQFYRNMLANFTHFFIQDSASASLIKHLVNPLSISISGDTRFDRVISIANERKKIEQIDLFCKDQVVIVAGSTWSEDDKVLQHFTKVHRNIKFIIAPHLIGPERLNECLQRYPSAILLTDYALASVETKNNIQTIVINNMGMLSSLYHYATIAFIGGGFSNEGIHNTLEAAVFGKPVVFGPVYEKYLEAKEMIEIGAAFSADTALEMEALLDELLSNNKMLIDAGKSGAAYVQSKAGASHKIVEFIQANRLLTN